jgi:hypothetical protein
MNDFNPKCRMCIMLASQESNVGPRSRVITTSNKDNFFHPLDSQSKSPGEGEPAIDMLNYPPAKITLRQSIFASGIHWEGQYCASPPRVRKRNLFEVIWAKTISAI